MNPTLFLQCAIAGVIGIAVQVVFKLISLKKRSEAANRPFSLYCYFQDDWLTIIASVLAVTIFIFILDEIVKFKPMVLEYIKAIFIFVGYTGSSLLQIFLSKTEKDILSVIDKKTNIADGITNTPA